VCAAWQQKQRQKGITRVMSAITTAFASSTAMLERCRRGRRWRCPAVMPSARLQQTATAMPCVMAIAIARQCRQLRHRGTLSTSRQSWPAWLCPVSAAGKRERDSAAPGLSIFDCQQRRRARVITLLPHAHAPTIQRKLTAAAPLMVVERRLPNSSHTHKWHMTKFKHKWRHIVRT
jgi:hypothetical protein